MTFGRKKKVDCYYSQLKGIKPFVIYEHLKVRFPKVVKLTSQFKSLKRK